MEILQVFGYFLKKFLIWDMKLGLETLCEYFQVCVKNGPIRSIFRYCLFSCKFLLD